MIIFRFFFKTIIRLKYLDFDQNINKNALCFSLFCHYYYYCENYSFHKYKINIIIISLPDDCLFYTLFIVVVVVKIVVVSSGVYSKLSMLCPTQNTLLLFMLFMIKNTIPIKQNKINF